jgi:hypothetical protein
MKNIVKTDEGPVALYGHLTTENWFEDFGSGTIRDGRSVIRLADDYLKTVSISSNSPMKVFITPKADIGRWWVEDGLTEFTLFAPDAPNGAEFDFRVVAKRPGHEGIRLEHAPCAYTDRHLYTNVTEVPARYQAEWLKAAEVNQSSPRNNDSDR